jgi:hypothetical protein
MGKRRKDEFFRTVKRRTEHCWRLIVNINDFYPGIILSIHQNISFFQQIKDIGTAEEYARCATWNGREMVMAQSLDEMRRFLDEIFPF